VRLRDGIRDITPSLKVVGWYESVGLAVLHRRSSQARATNSASRHGASQGSCATREACVAAAALMDAAAAAIWAGLRASGRRAVRGVAEGRRGAENTRAEMHSRCIENLVAQPRSEGQRPERAANA